VNEMAKISKIKKGKVVTFFIWLPFWLWHRVFWYILELTRLSEEPAALWWWRQ